MYTQDIWYEDTMHGGSAVEEWLSAACSCAEVFGCSCLWWTPWASVADILWLNAGQTSGGNDDNTVHTLVFVFWSH